VRRSSYHVSDGSFNRTTHYTHQAPQKAPPHATHYSAHNLSFQDTFFRLGCLGVHSGAHQRLPPDVLRTHRAGFGLAQEWEEWRHWLHWWEGDELPPMVPADPSVVRDATSSYLI
jgi:hypothetical protein